MSPAPINTNQFKHQLRVALEAENPRHAELDYAGMFAQIHHRASDLWVNRLRPELGAESCEAFERSLMRVGMRAGRAIPWILALGVTFGCACQTLAGTSSDDGADEAVLNTGVLMLVLGIFDHLLDDYPQELGDVTNLLTGNAVQRWTHGEDLQSLRETDAYPVAEGWANLYRLYFSRCLRYLNDQDNTPARASWQEALERIHAAEVESLERRRSRVMPSADIARQAEQPSQAGFRAGALTACLTTPAENMSSALVLTQRYARLTWLVDDVVDVEVDRQRDIWSGLGVRLAMEVVSEHDAEKIIESIAKECAQLIQTIYGSLGDARWHPDDAFTLADVLWAYIWTWLGGIDQQPELSKN